MDEQIKALDRRIDALEQGFSEVKGQLSTLALIAKVIVAMLSPQALQALQGIIATRQAPTPAPVYQLPPPTAPAPDPALPPEYRR